MTSKSRVLSQTLLPESSSQWESVAQLEETGLFSLRWSNGYYIVVVSSALRVSFPLTELTLSD